MKSCKLSLALGLLIASTAMAVPYSVSTGFGNGADSYVQLGAAGSNFGAAADVVIKDTAGGSTTRKGYLRFDLSGGSTAFMNAEVDLTVSINNEGGSGVTPQNHTVNVWGLKNGNAGENWGEGTINWTNAPANVTTNNEFTTGAVFLGRYSVAATPVGGVNTFNAGTLGIFLAQDTNDSATIMLQRDGGTGAHNLAYASDEHGSLAAPTINADTIHAQVLNITTNVGVGADAYVQQGAATTNFGSDANLVVKGGAGTTTRKAYTRFDLSALGNRDALAAGITLDVTTNNTGGVAPAADFTVEVFGLVNGDAGELWSEAGINWNNAPANTTDNNLLVNAVLLGSFLVPASAVPYSVTFSNAALLNFINADTNGAATLIFRRTTGGGENLAFGSGENTAVSPPTLTLIANVIPEPTSALLGLIGLAGLARRRQRA